MNVYSCFYQGNIGYVCRTRGKRWMFVPELGQPDGSVYKNVSIDELVFRNPLDRKFELACEQRINRFSLGRLLARLLFGKPRTHTVGGLLFTTHW